MKSNIKLLFATLIVCILPAFTSCGSDDGDTPTDEIVGTWEPAEVSSDGYDYMAWPFETSTITFNSNGKYSSTGYFGNLSGTWSKEGNIVKTFVGGKESYSFEILEITAKSSVLKMKSLWIRCIVSM